MRWLPILLAVAILFDQGPSLAAPEKRLDNPNPHPGWDYDTDDIRGDVPFHVDSANDLVRQGRLDDARLHLTQFFVHANDMGEDRVRTMVATKYPDETLAFFDRVRAEILPWGEDPAEVYEKARDLAKAAGIDHINPWFWGESKDLRAQTASALARWSAQHVGAEDIEYALTQGRLATEKDMKWGHTSLRLLASGGYAPAIIDIARRYETGDRLPRNPARALFWAMKGAAAGLPMQEQVDRLRRLLPPETVREVETKGTPYHP